jgi:hypothetical protein
MARHVEVQFPESGVTALAVLLDDYAPITCNAIWDCLDTPIDRQVIHAAYTGQNVVFYNFPHIPNIADVPLENHTVRAHSGEFLFFYMPAGRLAGMDEIREWLHPDGNIFEMSLSYGESDLSGPAIGGWRGCHWATLVEGREEFARECHRMRVDGAKMLRLGRHG